MDRYFCECMSLKVKMPHAQLLSVRKELGKEPILEAEIGGAIPLFVERYMYQSRDLTAPGRPCVGLVTFFGGSMAIEGDSKQLHSTFLPTQAMLIPPGTETHWHYTGTVDYAVFYMLDTSKRLANAVQLLAESRNEPMLFADPLVSSTSRQLLDELQKGPGADTHYMHLLVQVMFEQTFRTLTTPAGGSINPRNTHFSRLQAVLNFIRNNLASDVTVATLARIAGINVSYFRRIFLEATGMAPHAYVFAARLEQARKLLIQSELPIAQIATDCGFSNQSHLTSRFRAAHAVTPAQFRKMAGKHP